MDCIRCSAFVCIKIFSNAYKVAHILPHVLPTQHCYTAADISGVAAEDCAIAQFQPGNETSWSPETDTLLSSFDAYSIQECARRCLADVSTTSHD